MVMYGTEILNYNSLLIILYIFLIAFAKVYDRVLFDDNY